MEAILDDINRQAAVTPGGEVARKRNQVSAQLWENSSRFLEVSDAIEQMQIEG